MLFPRAEYEEYLEAMLQAKTSPELLNDELNTQLIPGLMALLGGDGELDEKMRKGQQLYQQLFLKP